MKKDPVLLPSEPWNTSLANRMEALLRPAQKKKVAYLYQRPDTSTFRYRVYNIFQALQESSKWQCSYFFSNELESLTTCLNSIDLIIICRFRWSFDLNTFILKAKKLHIPLAFDVDDLVFDIDKIPLLMNTLGISQDEKQYEYWFSDVSRKTLTAQLCDATIGTNAYLGNKLHEKFEKPNFIIPNFLNKEQLNCSEELYHEKMTSSKNSGKLTIGYFSGTPSHKNDFTKALPELVDFLNAYPQTNLEVVGFMEFPAYLQKFLKNKQIYHTPLVDFLTLQKKIANVDVNIVPLVDNEFTNCKSELKFFEAAIVGTTTCATPVHVFKENIVHGKTGFLCQEGHWFNALKHIYEAKIDPNMQANARDYCINKYAYYNQTKNIECVLDQLVS